MQLEVGKWYTWKGIDSKLVSKWAQGSWNTYTFEDGRSFNGDPKPMFASGELKDCLPPTKARPVIVETPDFLKKRGEPWQAPMTHPTQKEDREAGRGKTGKS